MSGRETGTPLRCETIPTILINMDCGRLGVYVGLEHDMTHNQHKKDSK